MKNTDVWCWERLKAGGEGDDRGWDGWVASPTQWTRVWVNSRSWWWTGRPGVLWIVGLQRIRHDWVTELSCSLYKLIVFTIFGQKVFCFLNLCADIWDYSLLFIIFSYCPSMRGLSSTLSSFIPDLHLLSPLPLQTLILMCFICVLSYICMCECSFALCIYFKCPMWKNFFLLHQHNFVQNGSTSREREEKSPNKLEDSKSRKIGWELGRCYVYVQIYN